MPSKERSPNYPGLPLEAAIQAIRQVYDRERRTVAPTRSVAAALGHESLSGPALTKIAALRQYGLLDDVGPGKVKVSDGAMPILLRDPAEAQYAVAIRHIALRPSLLSELFSEYADASDATLRYHLITDRGFSEEGATRVIKIFRANIEYAKLDGKSYDSSAQQSDARSEGWQPESGATINTLPKELRRQFEPYMPRQPEDERVAYSWPLPGGNDAQVSFREQPTARAVERLINYLEMMKDDLQEIPERLRDLEARADAEY